MGNDKFYGFIYLILTALFWGGFTVYSAFVVPIGMNILGSHTTMGFITQAVTIRLNFLGLLWVFSAFLISKPKFNYLIVSILALILILFGLHSVLSNLMDVSTLTLKPNTHFYTLHRIYLILSTLIWLLIPIHFYSVFKRIFNL
jgi:hypothetical protein